MRPLHWVKLPDAKVVGTIWVDADQSGGIGTDDNEAGLDRDAIEVIFGLGEERDRSASRSRATSVGANTCVFAATAAPAGSCISQSCQGISRRGQR